MSVKKDCIMAKVNDELKAAVKQAMHKPHNFMFAQKGKEISLTLSKKSIPPAMRETLKKSIGAQKVFTGVCEGNAEGFTFKSADAIPVTLAPIMRNHIKTETGLVTAPRFIQETALAPIDDDTPDDVGPVKMVDPGKSSVDVDARLAQNAADKVSEMRDHMQDHEKNRKGLSDTLSAAQRQGQKLQEDSSKIDDQIIAIIDDSSLTAEAQKSALEELRSKAEKIAESLEDNAVERKAAVKKVATFDNLSKKYSSTIAAFDAAATDEARIKAVQGEQIERIREVRAAMGKVYDDTNRKLMILGRLQHTIGGDKSWLKAHQRARDAGNVPGIDEEGRVLGDGAWSMAVNDAFVKAGLDQKAEVLLATQFNQHDKKDEGKRYDPDQTNAILKNLTGEVLKIVTDRAGMDGRNLTSKQEIKDEVRKLVKDKLVVELQGRPEDNDGFSIYMLEIEQLIDDNYVMMVHNPEADRDHNPKVAREKLGDGNQVPDGAQTVMVPSGTGQKIGAELKEAARIKSDRTAHRESLLSDLRGILGDADKKRLISANADAKTLATQMGAQIKKGDYDAAEISLGELNSALGTTSQ